MDGGGAYFSKIVGPRTEDLKIKVVQGAFSIAHA